MGMGGQRHAPAALPSGKTRYPLWRWQCGPQGRSGRVRKFSPQPGFDPRTVQPVQSRYTDWAIPTHTMTGENRSNRRKPCPSACFSTTNLKWSDMKSNTGLLRDGRLENSKYELRYFSETIQRHQSHGIHVAGTLTFPPCKLSVVTLRQKGAWRT